MFSAIRAQACQTCKPHRLNISRCFASIASLEGLVPSNGRVPPPPSSESVGASEPTGSNLIQHRENKVPVRADHGLYEFFRRKPELVDASGEDAYMTLDRTADELTRHGRAWKASELRLKSFHDLHTLWYILVRERNLLATQLQEMRRSGIRTRIFNTYVKDKDAMCRISQARIKQVLNERRLAYEGAVELAESQRRNKINAQADETILKYRQEEFEREAEKYRADEPARNKRRADKEKRLQAVREARQKAAAAPDAAEAPAETLQASEYMTVSSTSLATEVENPVSTASTAPTTDAQVEQSPADRVSASLFGSRR